MLLTSYISEKNMFADSDHRLHNLHILRGDDAVLLLCTISVPLRRKDLYVALFLNYLKIFTINYANHFYTVVFFFFEIQLLHVFSRWHELLEKS